MSLERLFDLGSEPSEPGGLYLNPSFPPPPVGRPYVFVNMVCTADGKILIGPRGSTAKGVGGPTDQLLMHRLEEAADGIIIGAGTLRPGNVVYPPRVWRAVVTRSGDLPLQNRFFTDAPGRAIVFTAESVPRSRLAEIESVALLRIAGADSVDVTAAARILREEFGIARLLLEGGADLNFDFFSRRLVDELFLSVAPKIKGGASLPTPVEGPGFPDREFAALQLVSVYRDGSELYLRYRVPREV